MLRKTRDKNKIYKIVLVSIVIFLVVFLYNKTKLGSYLSYNLNQISIISINTLNRITAIPQNTLNQIKFNRELYKENLLLKDKVEYLNNQLLIKDQEITNNQLLKDEIKYHNSLNKVIATTSLFAMTPGPYTKEAFISSGKDASIAQGDVVLYDNMLLGRVVEVYDNYSKILLIFDSRSKISAVTESTGNKILLEGNNTNKLSVRYLIHTEHVQDLEFVQTSNYCSIFPPGIRIGLINRRNHSVYIQVPYKNTNIRYVQVIRHNF